MQLALGRGLGPYSSTSGMDASSSLPLLSAHAATIALGGSQSSRPAAASDASYAGAARHVVGGAGVGGASSSALPLNVRTALADSQQGEGGGASSQQQQQQGGPQVRSSVIILPR